MSDKLTANDIKSRLMARLNELDLEIRSVQDFECKYGADDGTSPVKCGPLLKNMYNYRQALRDFYEEIKYK